MTTRTKKLGTLLTAGVVLSSGAYALGSQAGDGGAVAARTATSSAATNGASVGAANGRDHGPRGPRGFGRRGDFGLSALADRLGVSETALRDALRAMRDAKTPGQRRAELIQALATALNKPAADVRKAVDSVLPDRGDRNADLAAAIAKELGIDVAKVESAFGKLRRQFRDRNGRRGDRRDALVDAIAASTGADAAKVRAALDRVRDAARANRPDRRSRRDDVRQRLATALGVTPDQLDTALDKVRTDQRDAFATALAQRLNIDVQKVKDAVQDLPGPGRRHG